MLVTKNSDLALALNREENRTETVGESSNEVIPSDDEELSGLGPDAGRQGSPQSGSDEEDHRGSVGDQVTVTTKCRKRRHKRSSQLLTKRRKDYEECIGRTHSLFQGFRDQTIVKWNSKLRLASGKISNKVRWVCLRAHVCV